MLDGVPKSTEEVRTFAILNDIQAESILIGGIKMAQPSGYRVIIDRISHDIPFYRAYLKNAALSGTHTKEMPLDLEVVGFGG